QLINHNRWAARYAKGYFIQAHISIGKGYITGYQTSSKLTGHRGNLNAVAIHIAIMNRPDCQRTGNIHSVKTARQAEFKTIDTSLCAPVVVVVNGSGIPACGIGAIKMAVHIKLPYCLTKKSVDKVVGLIIASC